MMDTLIQFFNNVLTFFTDVADFFNSILDYIKNGLYDFFKEWFAAFVIWSTVAMIKAKLYALTFAWDVAQEVLSQLGISAFLSAAWGQIDSGILSAITFFRIPDAINVILSAKVTRFVLNFMGL